MYVLKTHDAHAARMKTFPVTSSPAHKERTGTRSAPVYGHGGALSWQRGLYVFGNES
jgi:hypothetical protein